MGAGMPSSLANAVSYVLPEAQHLSEQGRELTSLFCHQEFSGVHAACWVAAPLQVLHQPQPNPGSLDQSKALRSTASARAATKAGGRS